MSNEAATYHVVITCRRHGNEWTENECAMTLAQVEEIKREWSGIARTFHVYKLAAELCEDAGPWRTIDEAKTNANLFAA